MQRVRAPRAKNASSRKMAVGYKTPRGRMFLGLAEDFLASAIGATKRGKVQLILTSPPFPLNRKKRYGNLQGEAYVKWLADFAQPLRKLLKRNGSIVLELGNAWEPGKPLMSTLALKALIAFLEAGNLKLCQQFICYNPARLPSPAQWVTVKRCRVKDAYTHVWWMAPSESPLANNRNVLTEYSPAMRALLKSRRYNTGSRPSEHTIGKTSFCQDNGGAIPSNVLRMANTSSRDMYYDYCRRKGLAPHPARMQRELPEFFIKFLTNRNSLVFDPFGGSNTTGAAAERLGRRWIAVEPNKDYLQGSRGRFGEKRGANRRRPKE